MLVTLGLMAGLALGAGSPCGGATPSAGAELHGPALHVIDGRTLCIAQGPDASTWIPVRLGDAPDGADWGALMAAAFAKTLDCRIAADGTARCAIAGRALGDILSQPSVQAAGQTWRRHATPGARPTVVAALN